MPDNENKNPTIEMLVEEITNLKNEVKTLKQDNANLTRNVNDVVAVNRKLLSSTETPRAEDDNEKAKEKLLKFLKGE